MSARCRGFTLIEMLLAVAIAAVLGTFLLRSATAVLHWTLLESTRAAEHAQIGELVDRLQAEEDSAWAIFTPLRDVTGGPNADGHEVDFFTRDATNKTYFWAYTYDAAAQTLTRSLYGTPGGPVTTDVTYTGITGFFARTYPITALQDPSSKIYSPLYNAATLHEGAVSFFPGTPIAGGNQITYVKIQSPTLVRELQLATQTAPSGFIVVLQYTPAPTPTPKVALSSWPQYIELPLTGQALQTAALPPSRNMGFYINRLLGGAVAEAALAPCATNQARAFADGPPNWAVPLANAIAPAGAVPAGVTASTDASGCVTFSGSAFTNGMPNVALWEPGYSGTFSQSGNTCAASVKIRAEYPYTAQGPEAQMVSEGGSPLDPCSISWSAQQTSAVVNTTYRVIGCASSLSSGIVPVGSNCTLTAVPWPNDNPSCTAPNGDPGGIVNGYDGTGRYAIAPSTYGSTTLNGDGSVTFMRTSPGQVTLTASGHYVSYQYAIKAGVYQCVPHSSYNVLTTWTIN